MGCLNSKGQFDHWFANIHFSGPCNRKCYFCIGQHMPGVDPINNLDTWPLLGISKFLTQCKRQNIREVNLTGSDTDPLLYNHLDKLVTLLRTNIPDVRVGVRTNGALILNSNNEFNPNWSLFDKASISITSFEPEIYQRTMGRGKPPDLKSILQKSQNVDIKVNVVICPETLYDDLAKTLNYLADLGVRRVNVREPYGQPRIGDPMPKLGLSQTSEIYGMPQYKLRNTLITYWDVHYVEVESVNLYANGNVSLTYPVSEGHDPTVGKVLDQSNFKLAGRQFEQWRNKRKLAVV